MSVAVSAGLLLAGLLYLVFLKKMFRVFLLSQNEKCALGMFLGSLLIVPLGMGSLLVLTVDSLDYERFVIYSGPLVILAIGFHWVYVHISFYRLVADPDALYQVEWCAPSLNISSHISRTSSLFVCVGLLVTEAILFIFMRTKNNSIVVFCAVSAMAIPVLTIGSIALLKSNVKRKLLLLKVGQGVLPIILSAVLANKQYPGLLVFCCLISVGTLYSLFLRHIHKVSLTAYYLVSCICSFAVIYPLTISVPLLFEKFIDAPVMVPILFASALTFFVLVFFVIKILNLISKKARLCGEMITFTIFSNSSVLLILFSDENPVPMLTVVILAYLLGLLEENIKLHPKTQSFKKADSLFHNYQGEEEHFNRKSKKMQLFFLLIAIGSLLYGSVGNVVYIYESSALGIYSLFLIVLTHTKKRLKLYGQLGITLGLAATWLLLLFPYTVLLRLLYTKVTQRTLFDIFVGYTIFLFVIGVAVLSILYNIISNKLREERQAVAFVTKLQNYLEKLGVLGHPRILRIMFDQYKLTGPQLFNERLYHQQNFCIFIFEKDVQGFSTALVSVQVFNRLEKTGLDDLNPENTHRGCFSWFGCVFVQEKKVVNHPFIAIPSPLSPKPSKGDCFQPENCMKPVQDQFPALPDITSAHIPRKLYEKILRRKQLQVLLEDEVQRTAYYSRVFHFFARGDALQHSVAWMDKEGLTHLIRLTGILRFSNTPQSDIDVMYYSMTLNNGVIGNAITEHLFADNVLPKLWRIRYAKQSPLEQELNFLKYFMYPYLHYALNGALDKPIPAASVTTGNKTSTRFGDITRLEFFDPPPSEPCLKCSKMVANCCESLIRPIIQTCNTLGEELGRLFNRPYKIQPIQRVSQNIPEWEEVYSVCTAILDEFSTIPQISEQSFSASCSLSNLAFIGGKIIEYFMLAAIAFREEVDWGPLNQGTSTSSNTVMMELAQGIPQFWTGLILALLYVVIAIPALKQSKKDVLGKTSDGTPASMCACTFWLVKTVVLLGDVVHEHHQRNS